MNRLTNVLLALAAIGLCALCVAQWRREAGYRKEIESLGTQLRVENEGRVEAEARAAAFEEEIARLSQLRADAEARLLEVTEELNLTVDDQLARGISIAVLSSELASERERAARAAAIVQAAGDSITDRNQVVEEANQRIKQLADERDRAVELLNTRTKAYNELVEKYNKLAR
jgi:DNA repair exonuclease SbcCD ATPase subunit